MTSAQSWSNGNAEGRMNSERIMSETGDKSRKDLNISINQVEGRSWIELRGEVFPRFKMRIWSDLNLNC